MWFFLMACSQPGPPAPTQAEHSVSLAALQAQAAQQDLVLDPGVVRIDGTLTTPCQGRVRVDVLPSQHAAQPLTTLALWPGAKRFQVLAPGNQPLWVTAVCDGNQDGELDTENDRVTQLQSLGSPEPGGVLQVELSWP